MTAEFESNPTPEEGATATAVEGGEVGADVGLSTTGGSDEHDQTAMPDAHPQFHDDDAAPQTNEDCDDASSADSEALDELLEEDTPSENEDDDVEDEEEEECRVCRGPAEPEDGRPLFSPCKCTGSIGLCHQDCLKSWLEVTNGDGRCELCKYKFRFRNLYSDDAPTTLSPGEVVLGLSRRTIVRYLPFVVRIAASLAAWLIVLPVCSAYLYQGWLHGPASIAARFDRSLLLADGVAGAVVAAIVIISFLSLMSLADFMRFQWQPQGEDEEDGGGGGAAAAAAEEEDGAPADRVANVNANPAQAIDRERLREAMLDAMRAEANELLDHDDDNEFDEINVANDDEGNIPMPGPFEFDARQNNADEEGNEGPPVRNRRDQRERQRIGGQSGIQTGNEDEEDNNSGVDDNNDEELRPINRNQGVDGTEKDTQGEWMVLENAVPADSSDNDHLAPTADQQKKSSEESDPLENEDSPETSSVATSLNELDEDEIALENMMRAQEEAMNQDDDLRDGDERPNMPLAGNEAVLNNINEVARPAGNAGAGQQAGEGIFDPLDPAAFDQDADMEFQLALDELLGFRGPFGDLVRNLLWLLAFITAYMGLFAFLPYHFGAAASKSRSFAFIVQTVQRPLRRVTYGGDLAVSAVNISINASITTARAMYNATLNDSDIASLAMNDSIAAFLVPPLANISSLNGSNLSVTPTNSTLQDAFLYYNHILNAESDRNSTILKLNDITTLCIGYVVIALTVFLWQAMASLYGRLRKKIPGNTVPRENQGDHIDHRHPMQQHDFVFDNNERAVNGNAINNEEHGIDHGDEVLIEIKLSVVIETSVAVMKVCVLLFLKMVLLPLVLGAALDLATLELFSASINSRVLYAGRDLFGSLLLHWVSGITFMLLVTISVLQLREVIHPDLLARFIRPQEPQPDLLGNLLKDRAIIHTKRMLVSLSIYLALLVVHIYIPAKLLTLSGISSINPVFRPEWRQIILPQIQVPVELLLFHLSMLSCLEKYKNYIGKLQHIWLGFICRKLGLIDYLLPKEIGLFSFVESKPIFLYNSDKPSQENIDPFWIQLNSMATDKKRVDEFIRKHVEGASGNTFSSPSALTEIPSTTATGKRILPDLSSGRVADEFTVSLSNNDTAFVFPTSIKAYRFRLRPGSHLQPPNVRSTCHIHSEIEIWKEVPGDLISRPPDGWDDLQGGGAAIQLRWAWDKEKKSKIEEGVAQRRKFLECQEEEGKTFILALVRWLKATPVMMKVVVLSFFSWAALSMFICVSITLPLVAGRGIFSLFYLSDRFLHDPIAYAIGVFALAPVFYTIGYIDYRRVSDWTHAIKFPSQRSPKLQIFVRSLILWFSIIPVLVGIAYHLFFVKESDFWQYQNLNRAFDLKTLILAWAAGSFLTNGWALLCYFDGFKPEFWLRLVLGPEDNAVAAAAPAAANGAVAPIARNADAQNNAVAAPQPAGTADITAWQGDTGLVAQYVNSLIAVLGRWEWDKVDKDIMIQPFLPIARHLLILTTGPLLAHFCWSSLLSAMTHGRDVAGILIPIIGIVKRDSYHRFCYRCFFLTTAFIQLSVIFQKKVQLCFRAAHNAARDDRYLIGETLVNYDKSR